MICSLYIICGHLRGAFLELTDSIVYQHTLDYVAMTSLYKRTDSIKCYEASLHIARINDQSLHPCWLKMSFTGHHPLK